MCLSLYPCIFVSLHSCMLLCVCCILYPVSCLLWQSVGLRIRGPKPPKLPPTQRVLRVLPDPANPQKVTFKTTPPFSHPKLTQGDPKMSVVQLLATQMTPTWRQKSTFFATGRAIENRAPAAARTLLSTLGQIPKSMKKAILVLIACPRPPFSPSVACKHQNRRLQSPR